MSGEQPVEILDTLSLDANSSTFITLVRLTATDSIAVWRRTSESAWRVAAVTHNGTSALSSSASQQLNSATPTIFDAGSVQGSRIDDNTAIFTWEHSSGDSKARIVSWSGGTLTLGTEASMGFPSVSPFVVALSTTKALWFRNREGGFGSDEAIVLTLSGTTVSSVGTSASFTSHTNARVGGGIRLSSSSALVVYGRHPASINDDLYAIVVSESGGTPSGGTPVNIGTGAATDFTSSNYGGYPGPRYGVDLVPSGDYLLSWVDAAGTNPTAEFAAVSVSGTTVTLNGGDDFSSIVAKPRGALVDGGSTFLFPWGESNNLGYLFPFDVASDGSVTAGTYSSPAAVTTGADDLFAAVATSDDLAVIGFGSSVRLVRPNIRQTEWYAGMIRGVA